MQILRDMNIDDCVVIEMEDLSDYAQLSDVAYCQKKPDMSAYMERVSGYNVFGGDSLLVEISRDGQFAGQNITGQDAALNVNGQDHAFVAVQLPESNVSSETAEAAYKSTICPGKIETGVVGTDGRCRTERAVMPAKSGNVLLDSTLASAVTQELADALWPFLSSKVFPEG